MKRIRILYRLYILLICLVYASCKIPKELQVNNNKVTPSSFLDSKDTVNSAQINWREFFVDKNLVSLIDTAIKNNPDVLMTLQEIEIARNRVMSRDALLSPSISAGGGLGLEKVGRYTSQGAGDASAEIIPGKLVPEHLTDFLIGFHASWEADIWGKIRSSKKAAFTRYLGSIEGKNFVITNLVAEVANSYYELLSIDNQLEIIRESIQLQKSQLEIVRVQKEASVVTELAVKQFEARVFNSQGLEFELLQKITEYENKINFLLGRFPQKIIRDKETFSTQMPAKIKVGIPSQLLVNRPDIKQAELELLATKCDAKAARLEFYPSLDITSSMGFQAFKPSYLLRTPQSLLYSLISDVAGPIVNRKAITAEFNTANALQVGAMYNYQKTILNGFAEVSNELSNINNLEKVYNLKSKEVEVLIKSIDISNDLFKSARANYLEVLMAQRDALESKLELVEARKRQFNSITNIYKALGGGWK
ncbi:MAG: efflux transporter outer membrane subunit [Chitinophagia bacterium]|nr:efflux transporter outer membrane subunit [Chitinophagia bacterium]